MITLVGSVLPFRKPLGKESCSCGALFSCPEQADDHVEEDDPQNDADHVPDIKLIAFLLHMVPFFRLFLFASGCRRRYSRQMIPLAAQNLRLPCRRRHYKLASTFQFL